MNLSWFINKKKWLWYVIPVVLVISLIAVTLEVHTHEEKEIRKSFLENQIEIQQTVTDAIANNISSEIQLTLAELRILANSDELQDNLGSAQSSKLIQNTFRKINSIAPTAKILAVDENFEVVSQVSLNPKLLVGKNLAKTRIHSIVDQNPDKPQIYTVFGPPFKRAEIAVVYPVIDKQTEASKGILIGTFVADQFFTRHGNIYDVDSQFIAVIDKNHSHLVNPVDELIGDAVFGEKSLEFYDYNQTLRAFIENLLEGNSGHAIYDFGLGERLTTGHPIIINENNEMFLLVVWPTSTISGEVGTIISTGKIQTSILTITTVAILGVLLFKRTKIFEQEKLATIGQLSSNIAHDLRNPLGTIKNSTRRIQNQNKNNNINNQIISDESTRIDRAVKRMSHQIEGVLNYVRSTPIIPTKISIMEMLNYSLDVANVPNNIKIHLPEKDMVIECDSEKIENVFVNLIVNAIQAIDKDIGTISIKLTENKTLSYQIPQSEVKIEFENSGPPIPDDKLSEIFKPLFTTKLKGTGLGLSGCKNIVEQHKGKINATSNPVIFTIILPKKLDDELIDTEFRNEFNTS